MVKITILISLYKEPLNWITQTFKSIESQTLSYNMYNYVVINDYPERSVEINQLLETLIYRSKDRLIFISNEDNIGLTKSLNKGFLFCDSTYVARMDADDLCYPDRLFQQYTAMEDDNNIDISFTKMTYINDNGEILHNAWTPNSASIILKNLESRNFIPHPSVMFRKSSFDNLSIIYNEEFKKAQDKALWILCRDKGLRFHFIDNCLIYYRLNSSSVSTSEDNTHSKRLLNSAIFNGNNQLARKLLINERGIYKLWSMLKTLVPRRVRFVINSFIFR